MSIKRFIKNVKGSLFWKRVTAGVMVILMIGTLILPERFMLWTRADDQLPEIESSIVENPEGSEDVRKEADAPEVLSLGETTEADDITTESEMSNTLEESAESEASDEGEALKDYPAFIRSESVDGVRVTVTAACGVFPAGAALSVEKASDTEKQQIEQAVDAVREDSVNVAQSYTFDIKVLDENGNEIQPVDGQTVNVSFAMDEVSNQNLSTDIYHIPEENGTLVAEELNTSESGNTVTAVSDGFSYYTVEFTYDEKQYVMEGDTSVALTDILSYVGITKMDGSVATDSDITVVSVSDESLFSALNESGVWIVTAHQAFHTDEWMKVTVDGVEYEIVVTDATTYTTSQTNLGWISGDKYVCNGSTYSFKESGSYCIYYQNTIYNGANTPAYHSGSTALIESNGTLKITNTEGTFTFSLPSNCNAWTLEHEQDDEYRFNSTTVSVDPTYVVTGNTGAYDGTAKNLVTTSGVGGAIHYRYKLSTDSAYSSWQTGIPSAANAGSYSIQWYSESNSSYSAKGSSSSPAGTVNATISRANGSGSVTMADWNFDATPSNPIPKSTTNGTNNVTYKYKVKGAGDSTYIATKPTNAGEYTVQATFAATTNYNATTATADFKINKATMTGLSATGYTGAYDASGHSITVTAPDGATVKYRTTDSGAYNLSTAPTYTDVGTYTVYYQVTKANYETVIGSATVQIDPIELTLTWGDVISFTYNGSLQVPTATISGVINGDDCTVSVNGAQTNYNANAYTATAVLNGAKKGNYKLPTEKTKPFTISKKAAAITANAQTVTYGISIVSDTAHVTTEGFVDGDTLTAITLTPSTNDVTTDGTITPSVAIIKKGDTDVTNNYDITFNTGNLTINKKSITISGITASNKTYDGTIAATLDYSEINWADCGKVGTDDLSVTAAGAFLDANIGTGKTVTISDLALSGSKADNYELASSGQQTSTTADITAKALTIKADNDSKVYDGTTHTKNSYRITSGELADGDTIGSVIVTGSQKYAGSSDNIPSAVVIKNSSDEDVTSNYNITYTNGTIEVTKKPLTITADSDTKEYDAIPLTKNSYTHTELVEGDSIESVTVTGSQTAVGEGANVPSAAVIKNGDDDVTVNYDITYVNGTLKVTKKVVTITADSDTKVYDGTPLTKESYTVSGLEEGDRIDSVTITGSRIVAGESANVPSAAVIKNSSGEIVNDNYAISYVNGTLEVTKKAVTITAGSDTKVYDGTALAKDGYINSELATGDRIASVTVTGSKIGAGASANVPSAAVIKNAANEDVTASYNITYENGTLEVTKKAVTITADGATKEYDGTALTKDSYTNSDLAAGDRVESVTVTGSRTSAGESANVPSAAVIKNASDEDVTASYDITYVDGTLKVTKKQITISGITVIDKTYDGTTDAELDYSDIDWIACGMVDGDELSITAKGTYEDTNVGEDKRVIITDITLGGRSADNYVLSDDGHQTRAAAKITKKAVTLTALKQTVAVNGEIENTVEYAELSGTVEGHKLAEITLTSSSTEKTTTEGVITPSAAKIVDGAIDVTDNYDITYIDGVMTVTKSEAEVVLDNGDDEAQVSVTEVEVPNLQDLADEEAEEGKLVKVELSVKPVSENNISSATVSDVKEMVESVFAFVDKESVKVEYLEIDLTKYVDNVKDSTISDTGTPLEIILTYDTSKAGNPVIIRSHEGTVKVFTQLSSRPAGNLTDATYYIEGDKIYMYSQYFSDFAIAYSMEKTYNVSLDDGNGNIIRQIVSEGTKYQPPTDLTKDGYDFDGWYKDDTFTGKWNSDTDKVTSDIKLYAKWTKKTDPEEDTEETTTEATTANTTEETTTEVTTAATTTTTAAAASTSDATTASTKVEEKTAPKTGDATPIAVLVVLMLTAAGMLVLMDLKKKKN